MNWNVMRTTHIPALLVSECHVAFYVMALVMKATVRMKPYAMDTGRTVFELERSVRSDQSQTLESSICLSPFSHMLPNSQVSFCIPAISRSFSQLLHCRYGEYYYEEDGDGITELLYAPPFMMCREGWVDIGKGHEKCFLDPATRNCSNIYGETVSLINSSRCYGLIRPGQVSQL
eukprot:sb/3471994/